MVDAIQAFGKIELKPKNPGKQWGREAKRWPKKGLQGILAAAVFYGTRRAGVHACATLYAFRDFVGMSLSVFHLKYFHGAGICARTASITLGVVDF